MLKSRLKKHLPSRKRIAEMPPFRRLGIRFSDPAVWLINRTAISRATAIGLFCAYLPMPLEMLPAALLAMLWRANLPLAVALVWLSNPFTWLVVYTPPYLLGSALLGETAIALDQITVEAMLQRLAALWLGCLLFGLALGCAGYFAVRMLWRMVVVNTREKRRHAQLAGRGGRRG